MNKSKNSTYNHITPEYRLIKNAAYYVVYAIKSTKTRGISFFESEILIFSLYIYYLITNLISIYKIINTKSNITYYCNSEN